MSSTDPIADMLTCIRNAIIAKKDRVDTPFSKIKLEMIKILKSEGYINNYKVLKDGKKSSVRIVLKYKESNSAISGLKRVSSPRLRQYVTKDNIPRVLNGIGIAILSTSRGVITDADARNNKIGGEVLCYVW